jgi:RsiW-degrading membrane proteinase PrsW (M82 family)
MVENIGYAFKGLNSGFGGFETIELRMFSAIPGHFIFGINMGFLFGLYKLNKKHTTLFLLLSIICPTILHGSYDYFHSAASLLILVIGYILNYSPLKSLINA